MKKNSIKNIKAILLAAGLGNRLRPLTNAIPKCMVQIGDKPLLAHWMDSLLKAGVCEAVVNTHWLANQVEAFANEWDNSSLVLKTFYEPELLGSAGTIAAKAEWASEADAILVIYADNFSRFDLSLILDHHFVSKSDLTLGVFTTPEPFRCGIVELDIDGRCLSFEEKPSKPKGNLAAAGLYVMSPGVIGEIKDLWNQEKGVFDLGFDVFPRLIHRATPYHITEPLIDIGTIEAYNRVCRDYRQFFSHL